MSQVNPITDIDPEDIDNDIYDEIANLEILQANLSELISTGSITNEEFEDEMLKTRYYIDIKTKTYILDEDEAELLEKLRAFKSSLTTNYKMGLITEEEFNRDYIKILRKEYEILKNAESNESTAKKVDSDMDLPIEEKLLKLQKAETTYMKKVAKEKGIDFPKLPRRIKKEEVDNYYNLKLSNRITPEMYNDEIEEYIKMYSASKQKVDFYTSSFEVSNIFYNPETRQSEYEFKMIQPLSNKIDNITTLEERAKLLTPDEQFYSDRLNTLKIQMRKLSREELLKCAGVRTVKFMSYIERLRQNKQKVFKFRQHPENYKALEKILISENTDYYSIPSSQLFKEYMYSLPDVDSLVEDSESTTYLERGTTGYLAIKEGSNVNDLGEGLDNFVTVMPLQDELYSQLKETRGSDTEISDVWELRMSLPGSNRKNIIKRYLSFDDYLVDFKQVLLGNLKYLPDKSKDVLREKIRKVSYYISYKEDPDIFLPRGQMSVSDMFKDRSKIYTMRQNGLYKLLDYFTTFYPGCRTLVEKIETDTFNYSSVNYDKNISKIFFMLNNHPEKLDEIVEGSESIINILIYETPEILPDADISLQEDKQENIDKLLIWNPDTSEYDTYEDELERIQHRFYKFKRDHPELTNLYIEQIMRQYSEKQLWKRSLQKYNTLEVPEGFIELNYRLRFLLKQRNKLPSRRIYRIASVERRIKTQQELTDTFAKCNIPEPDKFAMYTEKTIYEVSKSSEDYYFNSKVVKTQHLKFCKYLSATNQRCTLDENGRVVCDIKYDPVVITPLITDFILSQGEFENVDILRLKNFVENAQSETVLNYIRSLRGAELEAYERSLIAKSNEENDTLSKVYIKAIRILKSARKEKLIDELKTVIYNTYVPPTISLEKPERSLFGVSYSKDYIKMGEYYVYGGYYPMFQMYNEKGEILKENYSRHDLEQLASIFDLDILEDSFELYKSIMQFINDYNKKEIVTSVNNFSPVDYTHYEYLKIPTKTINYAIRPRIGVKEPGEVYAVSKDQYKFFGVPFDFDVNTIPIYSEDLKEKADNGFIVIEGPCIFRKTENYNSITSDSYINVSYRDSRGKNVIFREGVSKKKILKRKIDEVDTCSRFTTQESCDDNNSYSLDINAIKFKCKWIKDKCKAIQVESDVLTKFDIQAVKFKDFQKNKSWTSATEKSIKFIEELVKLKELSRDDIKILIKEQKVRLFNYYNTLLETRVINKLPVIKEENIETKSYSLMDKFSDILTREQPTFMKTASLLEGYTEFTIYTIKSTQMKFPIRRIQLNKEYTVNGNIVIPFEYFKDDDTYECSVKGTSRNILLQTREFREMSNEIITKTVPVFCLVKNEDLYLLKEYPGYYYYDSKDKYKKENDEIVKINEITTVKTVPTNFITPSSILNGKPLISRQDIFNAMYQTAFSTLSTEDEFIFNVINKVNAEQEAIKFALKNNIDINELFKKIVGTITFLHVVEEYERLNPRKIITKTEISDLLAKAVEDRNKADIALYYTRAKKSGVDPELVKAAKNLLKELPDAVTEPIQETPKVEQKDIKPTKSVYISSRRR